MDAPTFTLDPSVHANAAALVRRCAHQCSKVPGFERSEIDAMRAVADDMEAWRRANLLGNEPESSTPVESGEADSSADEDSGGEDVS